jgi:PAS domain-containing protein
MSRGDSEDKRLRTAALKNVEEVLKARQRAESDLVAANEALERKTRELQQQRQWYEVTLSSIGDAVITTDVDSLVTFLNPVAEAMTGGRSAKRRGNRCSACSGSSTKTRGKLQKTPSRRCLRAAASWASRITPR